MTPEEYKKKNGVTKFNPVDPSPLPWHVLEGDVWHRVVSTNGKRVCNCRNLKDAELIVKLANKKA